MARKPRAAAKGVNPGGANIRVPPHRRAKPRRPTVNPGGPAIGLTPPVAPAPHTARKKKAARKAPVKRGAALGDAVPCCAAEALAASLRLTGHPVSDEDVLALFLRAGGNRAGAYLEDVLDAASVYGLAGVRLGEVMPSDLSGHRVTRAGLILGIDQPGPHTVFDDGEYWWSWGEPWGPFAGAVIGEAWSVSWGSA